MAEDKTPILISVGALVVSVFALGWNFYRDVILKARLKVTISIGNIHHVNKIHGPYITIHVTNLGPGPIICESVHMAKKSCLGFLCSCISKVTCIQNRYAHVMHDYMNPYSANLPKTLQVGEKITLLFPMDEDAFLAFNPTHVGVVDSFGRFHWATRSFLKRTKQEYFEKFKKKTWGSQVEKDEQSIRQ
jgi:hypothetical protein